MSVCKFVSFYGLCNLRNQKSTFSLSEATSSSSSLFFSFNWSTSNFNVSVSAVSGSEVPICCFRKLVIAHNKLNKLKIIIKRTDGIQAESSINCGKSLKNKQFWTFLFYNKKRKTVWISRQCIG